MASMTVDSSRQDRRQLLVAAAGTVSALAIGLGLVAWQGRQPGGEAARASQMSGHTRMATAPHPGHRPDEDIPANGPLGNIMPAPAGRAAVAPILYLVGTREAADAVQATIDGGQSTGAAVAVVGSAEDEARLLAIITNADAANAELGLPALQVIDLRTT